MAHILLIDSNPDNRKSLEGLLHYRTPHQFDSVTSHTDGARKAVSLKPDLIMINALLFMRKNYAFPRVMQQHDLTSHISFLVHACGRLDEVTEKQIQASGLATLLYLPASAEEIEVGIQTAMQLTKPAKNQGVNAVVWRQASQKEAQNTIRSEVKKTPSTGSGVKPVSWPTVTPPKEKTQPSQSFKKATFQSFSEKASQSKPPQSEFRPSSFRQADRGQVKGKARFKAQSWERIDPKNLKKRK